MNRSELQSIARLRIKEARILLDNGCCEGAYYLTGYAVECALKACVAKKTNRYDFPDKNLVRELFTHDLSKLVRLAGLEVDRQNKLKASKDFDRNWGIVKDWSEEKRYESSITEALARDMYDAVVSRKDGVLTWLKKLW